jgi:hypothetical protein
LGFEERKALRQSFPSPSLSSPLRPKRTEKRRERVERGEEKDLREEEERETHPVARTDIRLFCVNVMLLSSCCGGG